MEGSQPQSQPPEGEEINSEPLKYKTWVLKVSIHCEGCKRKVKRILHSVEGVYTIDIEPKQHKVTVTGNVDAITLIKKLEKSGKHAELYPNKNNNCPPHEGQQPPSNEEQQQQEQQQQQQNQNQNQNQNPVGQPQNVAINGDQQPQENSNPPPNQPQGGSGGGGGAKKKKKKKSNSSGNNNNNNQTGEQQQQQESNTGPQLNEPPPQQQQQPPPPHCMGSGPVPYPDPIPVNTSLPCRMEHTSRVYEYPPAYHAPPPVYAMSYSTSYPRSYSASYYSAPLPYSYAYAHHGRDVEVSLPPSDWNGVPSVHPSDTFEVFSDENPNACSVM